MWLLLLGLALLVGDVAAQGGADEYEPSPKIVAIAADDIDDIRILPITDTITPVRSPIRTPVRETIRYRPSRPVVSNSFADEYSYRGDPCASDPCGPNTRCERSDSHAKCHCLDGFVPDDHTINGCKPQCEIDNDCPSDFRCSRNRCQRVCARGACGLDANCEARNHRASCSCPPKFHGNPDVECRRQIAQLREPIEYDVDLCFQMCGEGADCRVRDGRPVCSCPRGAEGDPLTRCVQGECIEHTDCARHLACKDLRCIDPCNLRGMCGQGANCVTRSHQPICSCPRNHVGDPFNSCRRVTEDDVCQRGTCGANTNCRARVDRATDGLRAVCSCIENYIGDPIGRGCHPECERDSDCPAGLGCRDNRCRNPCVDGCGTDAYCDVVNNRAKCRCPQYYLGDAHSRCYAECSAHEDCSSHQACYEFRCIDPCEGACGTGADCKVENHQPICSCPRTHTGDPFRSCRQFTDADYCEPNPCGLDADCQVGHDRSGQKRPVCVCPRAFIGNPLIECRRGECESNDQCPDHEACYAYRCQTPCATDVGSVCGENANCRVKNHKPICSCPRGYTGDPLDECRVAPNARRPVGGGHQIGYGYDS